MSHFMNQLNKGEDPGQQLVTVQCRYDHQLNSKRIAMSLIDDTNKNKYISYPVLATNDKSVTAIRAGNLVFQENFGCMSGGSGPDNAVPVVDHLNGMKVNNKTGNPVTRLSDIEYHIMKGIRVVGVAKKDTGSSMRPSNEFTQVTVTTSGTVTMVNTSKKPIHVGDTIMWRLPDTKHINNNINVKMSLEIEPMRGDHFPLFEDILEKRIHLDDDDFNDSEQVPNSPMKEFVDDIYNLCKHMARTCNSTHTNYHGELVKGQLGKEVQNVKKMMYNLIGVYSQYRNRVIGRALTGAMPGRKFTLMLGLV